MPASGGELASLVWFRSGISDKMSSSQIVKTQWTILLKYAIYKKSYFNAFGVNMIRQSAEIKGHNEPSEKENHVMVKKHTLFFDTNFRKAKEKCAPEAIEAALNLTARITKASVVGFGQTYTTDVFKKFFDGSHYESQELSRAIKKAARIETLIYIGIYHSVWIKIAFFEKSKKDSFYCLRTAFSKEGCGGIAVSDKFER